MVLLSIFITIIYLFLIGYFVFGFVKILVFKLKNLPSRTTFSIIIPFRDEATKLPLLLQSLDSLEYPNDLFEIILIDDDSDDDSVEVIQKVLDTITTKTGITRTDISIIKNKRTSNSPKKDAITTAIKQAKNKWIITTDADCIVPKFWLASFDEYIQEHTVSCIAAPVTYTIENTFLNRFQLLDILSLQGATIGGFGIKKPFLCNGANFAYKKELFLELNGFEGNTNIASGDDIFLLEKAVKTHPKNVHYLKCNDAIVSTQTEPSWKALKSQRIRWASKTRAYNNWFGKLTGFIVLLENLLVVSLLFLTLLNLFNIKIFIYLLIIKFSIDFYLIYKSALFFKQKNVFRSYGMAFVLYPFFTTYIAILSTFSIYKWKDRDFKQ